MLDALVRVVLAQVFTSGRVDPAALANLHTVWQCCEMRSNYGGQPVEERASKQDLAFWKARACQAHVHDGVARCFDARRRYDRGAANASLRELSLEAAEQCRRALQLHQAVRGQLGCLSLAAGGGV